MKYIFNKYSKLSLAIVISFFVSTLFIKNVFIANSPRIDSTFFTKLKDGIEYYAKVSIPTFLSQLSFDTKKQQEKQVADLLQKSLQPVSKGVRASSNGNYSYGEFNLNEIEWIPLEIIGVDGIKKTIFIPR